MLLYIFLFFANNWIWRVINSNFIVFLLISIESVIIFLIYFKKVSTKIFIVFWLIFFMLVFWQIKITVPQSLNLLDNDEQRVQKARLKFYNPSDHYIRVIFYRLNLVEKLEGDFNTISTRIQRNFFESLDLNVYFFAGHPRERVWANDFVKFPFVLIVPFLLGLYRIIFAKKLAFIFYFLFSVIILSLIGHKNILGPFVLFPLMILTIYLGTESFWEILKKKFLI